jgi:hypothetical protein
MMFTNRCWKVRFRQKSLGECYFEFLVLKRPSNSRAPSLSCSFCQPKFHVSISFLSLRQFFVILEKTHRCLKDWPLYLNLWSCLNDIRTLQKLLPIQLDSHIMRRLACLPILISKEMF